MKGNKNYSVKEVNQKKQFSIYMTNSNCSKSPQKEQDQTCLSMKQRSLKPSNKLKSKSEINIRKKQVRDHLNEQIQELKDKIQVSKDILLNIYSKVKRKESIYENQLSKKELNLHRINKLAQDYKKMYEDGLRMVESCTDRNQADNLKRKELFLNPKKLNQLKKTALQSIKHKQQTQRKDSSLIKTEFQIQNKPKDFNRSIINQPHASSLFICENQKRDVQKNKEKIAVNRMRKSSSAINTTKKYQIPNKARKVDSHHKDSQARKQTLQKFKQKQNGQACLNGSINKQAEQKNLQKLLGISTIKQATDEKKSLYEIYRQKIQKRQKQLNSQKMSWIVDKLKQNIDDLKLIRKKSQIKLKKHSKQKDLTSIKKMTQIYDKQQKIKHPKQQNKKLKQSQTIRQKSKQKYLQIQKSKLRSINDSLT